MKRKLTKAIVQDARPRAKDHIIWCGDLKGFGLRIHPTSKRHPEGRKVFIVQGRDPKSGLQFRRTIGAFGLLTTEMARDKAREHLSKITLGDNPFVKTTSMTFKAAFDLWAMNPTPIDRRTGKPRKASGAKRDQDRLRLHVLPTFGHRRLADIKQPDIAALKLRLEQKRPPSQKGKGHYGTLGGATTAKRTIAVLKSLLGHFVDQGFISENPAANIKLPADSIRGEFLVEAEIPQFLAALAQMRAEGVNPKSLDQIELLLRTGCRKNEIQRLKWDEVCLPAKELRLMDTKTHKRTAYICDKAFAIISRQRKTNSAFVFPSDTKAETYNQGAAKIFRELRRRINRPALTLHGLRHTHASRLATKGAGGAVVSAVLGIKSPRLIYTYTHTHPDEVRRRQNELA